MGGAVVIEAIFNLPGMGTAILAGITGGETMLVQGAVIVVALAFVIDLCCAGDERGIDVIHDAGFALGSSLGSLANILDPEVIVLSGGVIHGKDGWRSVTWRDSIREGFARRALDPLLDTPILIGTLESDAPLIGVTVNLLASLN